jgi:(p)ppGpp synthase/HD superfamily hydrolase
MKVKAELFALEKHCGQLYGEHDYSYHLKQVVDMVDSLYGDDDELKTIAWLHDVIEDTNATPPEIKTEFGVGTMLSVLALTKVYGESYADYILKVKSNEDAIKVKIADTMCNLIESIKESSLYRTGKYAKQLHLLTN